MTELRRLMLDATTYASTEHISASAIANTSDGDLIMDAPRAVRGLREAAYELDAGIAGHPFDDAAAHCRELADKIEAQI